MSWLSPMKISSHLDFSGDGVPDVVLRADYACQGGFGGGAVYVVDGAKLVGSC